MELINQNLYPQPIRRAVVLMGPRAVAICNRWMLGWPQATRRLIAQGELISSLKTQAETEADVIATNEPQMRHLARHEILEVLGINPAPPEVPTGFQPQ